MLASTLRLHNHKDLEKNAPKEGSLLAKTEPPEESEKSFELQRANHRDHRKRGYRSKWLRPAELIEIAKAGDLIEFHWAFNISHWAVYVGEKDGIPTIIHYYPNGSSWFWCLCSSFICFHNIRVGENSYSAVGRWYKKVRINNSHDSESQPLQTPIVLTRAYTMVGYIYFDQTFQLGESHYCCFWNNCKHFAFLCRYGTLHPDIRRSADHEKLK